MDKRWRECAKHGYSCRWNVVHIVYVPPTTVHARRTSSNDKTSRRRSPSRGYRSCLPRVCARSLDRTRHFHPCRSAAIPLALFSNSPRVHTRCRSREEEPSIRSNMFFHVIGICMLMWEERANCRRSVPAQRSLALLVKHPRSFDEAAMKDWHSLWEGIL